MLAEAHGLRESILTHSPFSIVSTGASAFITGMNPPRSDCSGTGATNG